MRPLAVSSAVRSSGCPGTGSSELELAPAAIGRGLRSRRNERSWLASSRNLGPPRRAETPTAQHSAAAAV